MANEKVILDFVGDPSGLKPIVKALKSIGQLTKKQEADFNKATASFKKRTVEMNKQKSVQNQLNQKTKESSRSIDEMAKRAKAVPKALGAAKAQMTGLKTGAQSVSGSFKRMGSSLMAALGIGGVLITAVRLFTDLVTVTKDFELQMARVKAITGATSNEFTKLEKNAKELGATTKFTASQVGKLQEEYGKLGFKTEEILNATEATLLLAEATGSDLAEAASVAGSTLRAFGLDASETSRVTDVMALSFTSSALDMTSFSEAMKYVAPIAASANISIETTTALLGKLADSGLKGSVAGTGLKNLMTQLADGSSDLSKKIGFAVRSSDDLFRAFAKLESGNIDLSEALALTDKRSLAAFLTLIKGAKDVKALSGTLDEATGSTRKMAEIMRDTLSGDIDKAKSAWEGFMLSVEGSEGMRQAVQLLTKAISSMQAQIELGRVQDEERKTRMEEQVAGLREYNESLEKAPAILAKYTDGAQSFFKTGQEIDKVFDEIRNAEIKAAESGNKNSVQFKRTYDVYRQAWKDLRAAHAEAADSYKSVDEEGMIVTMMIEGLSKKLEEAEPKTKPYIRSLDQLQLELKELKEGFKKAEIGSDEWVMKIGQMESKTREIAKATREATKELILYQAQLRAGENQPKLAAGQTHDVEGIALDDYTPDLEFEPSISFDVIDGDFRTLEEMMAESFGAMDSILDEQVNAMVDSGLASMDQFEESANTKADNITTYVQAGIQAIGGMFRAINDAQKQASDYQLQLLENQFDSEEITRDEYDKKRKEILRKQAGDAKTARVFEAILGTAAAVVSALATGPPQGYVLAGISAALGAVQIATIASTPIPQFAVGTKEAPAGFKWVGEKGPELINDSGGYPIITHEESQILAGNPFGSEAVSIMKKYDIPQLHQGLFQPSFKLSSSAREQALQGSKRSSLSNDDIAQIISANLMFKDGGIIQALRDNQRTERHGFRMVAEALKSDNNPRTKW